MSHEEFDYPTATTVNGFTLLQVIAELQKPLPPAAYKPVPGATDLTDIDPAYLTEVATQVFGPIGFGWWYDYQPTDLSVTVEARTAKSGREYTVYTASLHKLIVRYRLLDAAGHTLISEPITATGGNDNEVESYAVRGALTNALGAAFAKLTWQLPVYKGQLSHRNAATFGENGKKPTVVTPSGPPTARNAVGHGQPGTPVTPSGVGNGQSTAATVPTPETANANGHDAELGALLNYVIPPAIQSKHAGKKLSEVSAQVLEWYATKMAVTTPESQVLKDKTAALLALQLQPA